MAKTIKSYKRYVESALKAAGKYSDGMKLTINATAATLRTLDMCSDDIDGLEATTVWEETRYGKKLAPHPVFKIQRDAQETLTKNCKALGLTYADLSKAMDGDTFADFMADVGKVK